MKKKGTTAERLLRVFARYHRRTEGQWIYDVCGVEKSEADYVYEGMMRMDGSTQERCDAEDQKLRTEYRLGCR